MDKLAFEVQVKDGIGQGGVQRSAGDDGFLHEHPVGSGHDDSEDVLERFLLKVRCCDDVGVTSRLSELLCFAR